MRSSRFQPYKLIICLLFLALQFEVRSQFNYSFEFIPKLVLGNGHLKGIMPPGYVPQRYNPAFSL